MSPTHEPKIITQRPSAGDNAVEREAQVDEIVARLRRIELDAGRLRLTERA